LWQGPCRLNEEVWQKGASIQRVIPVNLAGVVDSKAILHDDRPNVDAEIENHNGEETELCTSALTDALQVEDEAETKASNDAKEGWNERWKSPSSDTEVSTKISRPGATIGQLAQQFWTHGEVTDL
jgi:hypothetical protein